VLLFMPFALFTVKQVGLGVSVVSKPQGWRKGLYRYIGCFAVTPPQDREWGHRHVRQPVNVTGQYIDQNKESLKFNSACDEILGINWIIVYLFLQKGCWITTYSLFSDVLSN
jgi:hypothetical protein